jgi:nicotinate dehydrogenase subunit B
MSKSCEPSLARRRRIEKVDVMSGTHGIAATRRDLLKATGALLVCFTIPTLEVARARAAAPPATLPTDQVDSFLAINGDGTVTACCGHVDLGTGTRTALAQIVAEELDVAVARVNMVLGDTDRTPDQGPTIASATIQVAAVPLRQAAAQARQFLVEQAARRLGVVPEVLVVRDGVVYARDSAGRQVSYSELIAGRRFDLRISGDVPLKQPANYSVVGASAPRVDIPAKVTGGLTYVHDMRVPGMLHARVVRPPYAGVDSGPPIGNSLISVDRASIKDISGIVSVVVIKDFIGVVAEREENAIKAAQALKVTWKPWAGLPDLGELEPALRVHPSKPRVLKTEGDLETALATATTRQAATYIWPYQMHGSIGPSCAVADVHDSEATVWSGTQNPHTIRADLSKLLMLPADRIRIIRMEAAGCYGRNCADDVTADAALLSKAVGRPVRVQLMREQEHGWEPKGAAQLIDVQGGLDQAGNITAYDFRTRYPSNAAPTLALLLTGTIDPTPIVSDMGDRTAIPPYATGATRIVVNDTAPIVRAAWLRGVSALPNVFAHESFIDELAAAAKVDPLALRLGALKDARGAEVLKAVAERANWDARPSPNPNAGAGDVVTGRGLAYAQYFHSKFPGFAAAWAAWVAEVEVDRKTGQITIRKITVAHDCGLIVNPDGVRHQIHGNVIQATSRVLKEAVTFDPSAVTGLEWGAYPIITFPEVPDIEVVMISRPDQPALGAGESASVPSAAAIANAIFDATGARLREVPFKPERMLAGLKAARELPRHYSGLDATTDGSVP